MSLDLQLNAVYVNQDIGSDAIGANFTMLFRWHFLARDSWSLYFDGGAGVGGLNKPVPNGGTNFNFFPQAGAGVSFDLGESNARVMLGAKWLHISNGSTASDNPGADTFVGYVGINWPF